MKAFTTATLVGITLLVGLSCPRFSSSATAAVLVEESWNYDPLSYASGGTGLSSFSGYMTETTGGGTGWKDGSAWHYHVGSHTDGAIDIVAGSLLFSTLATSGNHLEQAIIASAQPAGTKVYVRPSRQVGVDVLSGDLWASFVYRRVDAESGGGNSNRWADLRDNTDITPQHPYHFGMDPKPNNSQGIKVRYDVSSGAPAEEASIQDGAVYLVVGKFANLGTTNQSGYATLWALSEPDYDAIKEGGLTEAELDASHTLRAFDFTPGPYARVLRSDDLLRFVIETEAGTEDFPFIIAWDELRYGTTLADVVPERPFVLGDVNGDGAVDGLDVDRFVALVVSGMYQAEADCNFDAAVDGLDIDCFVDLVIGERVESAPEPATWVLAILATWVWLLRRQDIYDA